ncbi:MAG TPA: cellulase family glycosylhydrolase [Mycobacteriales bacterium]|nr:cellulase family glycosylhydrolase [Mycobacteriales bacterium]
MSGTARERWVDRAPIVAVALIVTVLVAVGTLIANRGGSSPPQPEPTASPVADLPWVDSLAPSQLLTGDAATFDDTIGGWSPDVGTISVTTKKARVYRGSGALAAIAPASGGSMTLWSPPVKVNPGDRYVGKVFVRGEGQAGSVQLQLRFLNGVGATTDTDLSEPLLDSTSAWGQPPVVAAIAPQHTRRVQLGISFPHSVASEIQLVDDASLAQTPGGHARVVGPLTTRGNQILDGDGRPLILRGLQRFGLEGGTKNPLPTQAEIQQLSLWGANEVRISLGEQKWLAGSCHYEKDYPQVVDKVVRWVTDRGMVALINLHFATVGRCGTPTLTPMADSPGSLTFWQEVATRYQDNPLVAFDLFNEPYVHQGTWLQGGSYDVDGQTVAAAGMQQLYDTVRGTGATNLVVISGLKYAAAPPTEFVAGSDIAYGVHAYTCSTEPPPGCTTPDPLEPSQILDGWDSLAKTYPVIVSEFGWPNGDAGTYNAHVISYAADHHWGWSGFAWDGGTGGLFTLVQAQPASDGSTIEPNAGGMALVAGFAANWPAQP